MREIELIGGGIALVDDDDYELLRHKHWKMHTAGYVSWSNMLMHHEVMRAKKNDMIDHINGNKLDNRKSNLRLCNKAQNSYNSPGKVNFRKSKYRGVLPNKKRWAAQIQVHGKSIHLGTYDTQEQAALIYNNAAIKYTGEFAFLNEIVA